MKLQNSWNVHRFFYLSMLLLFLLAACGGSGPSVQDPGNPASTPGNISPTNGPIPGKEEFGMTKEQLFTAIENVEAEISACMREAGFEYVAVDYNTVRKGMTSDKSLPGMPDGEFMKEYGVGISTLYTGLTPQLSAAGIHGIPLKEK